MHSADGEIITGNFITSNAIILTTVQHQVSGNNKSIELSVLLHYLDISLTVPANSGL